MFKKKKQIELTEEQKEEIRIKDFFDRILPSTIKFSTDHYIIGDSYRCVWAIKEYPPTTEELALFSQLADRNNLTVRLYSRLVDALEQRKIIQNATRRNKLSTGSNDICLDIQEKVWYCWCCKGDDNMAKRAKGTGTLRKKDGRWEYMI